MSHGFVQVWCLRNHGDWKRTNKKELTKPVPEGLCGVLPLSRFDQHMGRKRNSTIDADSHLPSGRTRTLLQFPWNWMHESWAQCSILLYSACLLGHIAKTYPVALVMVPKPNTLIKEGSPPPLQWCCCRYRLQCHFLIATVYIKYALYWYADSIILH